MPPSISFETGRRTQTQSSGQPKGLRQQMEVWFFYQEGTPAESFVRSNWQRCSPIPSAGNFEESERIYTRALPKRVRSAFGMLRNRARSF
jgi:hypothetical protein